MLRRSHTVRAKFGFGKERKQTDSVVCYEILGGALSVTKSLSSSTLRTSSSIPSGFHSFSQKLGSRESEKV